MKGVKGAIRLEAWPEGLRLAEVRLEQKRIRGSARRAAPYALADPDESGPVASRHIGISSDKADSTTGFLPHPNPLPKGEGINHCWARLLR